MKNAAQIAREVESSYLGGVSANLKTTGSRFIAGQWFRREETDNGERVRAAMVDRRIYDREKFNELPHGRTVTVRGYERRWIFGRRIKSVTVATVMAPPGPLLDEGQSGSPPPPITKSQLLDHISRLITDGKAVHLVGVCSPSGFEDDVWNHPPQLPNVKLILVAPRPDGGWRVVPADSRIDARLVKLFDPEENSQKLNRIRQEIEARRIDLLTGSLSATQLARELDLPVPLVNNAFEAIARTDPELRVSKRGGEAVMYRGATKTSAEEDRSMSLAEWIRGLFSKEGEELKKINVLSEKRASLSTRLDRMYEDIGALEKREARLMEEGKAANSTVTKRRVAAQVARLRKDISRYNTSASILSKQINVISTHIHNLELAQTGSLASLPSTDELTEAAVNAEEILEQLGASDALVSSLEVSMADTAMSDDEADILNELLGEAEDAAKVSPEKSAASRPQKSAPSKEKSAGDPAAEG
ncbi:MAG: hypothetical protein KF841_10040 [Phycisphaerae bacterium]|nr:hypothetical protein [Phycisphaerae bacterium]